MTPLVIRRSAFRMWTMSLVGVPFVVLAVDVLTRRRITNALREILFEPEATQLFEPRDVIWAWVMLVSAGIIVIFGLKELMFPSTVVEANGSGLRLKLSGPLRPPTTLSWEQIDDIGSGSVADEGDRLPVLWVRLFEPELVPAQPWGARWIDERTVAMLAADWDRSAVKAAEEITSLALAAVTVPPVVDEPDATP
ncbi:MAG TPA: hypothetical protein VMS74_02035 [Acidimicrobiia bacterium]|nr:hypothetical protein [Acidimicrobiia bacterium]